MGVRAPHAPQSAGMLRAGGESARCRSEVRCCWVVLTWSQMSPYLDTAGAEYLAEDSRGR